MGVCLLPGAAMDNDPGVLALDQLLGFQRGGFGNHYRDPHAQLSTRIGDCVICVANGRGNKVRSAIAPQGFAGVTDTP